MGVCLVVAVGLTQDLTLVLLSEKKKEEKKKKKKKKKKTTKNTKQEFIYSKSEWRGIHWEEYMLCATASNNILENAIHEDTLCVTASPIVKKIVCVLLPA